MENFLRWNIAVHTPHHTFEFWLLFIASRQTKKISRLLRKILPSR